MKKLITPYECGFCKIKFRNPLFLIRHVELRHPRASDSKDSNDYENVFEFVSTSVKETDNGVVIPKESLNDNTNESSFDPDFQICDVIISEQTEFEDFPEQNQDNILSDIIDPLLHHNAKESVDTKISGKNTKEPDFNAPQTNSTPSFKNNERDSQKHSIKTIVEKG